MTLAPLRWVAPPNWPQSPAGWSPPPDWSPDPSWGPPPDGWQFWQARDSPKPSGSVAKAEPEASAALTVARRSPVERARILGARKQAKRLASTVASLQGSALEWERENQELREALARLGVLTVTELEQEHASLQSEITQRRADEQLRQQHALTLMHEDTARVQGELNVELEHLQAKIQEKQKQLDWIQVDLSEARGWLATAQDERTLQEVGLYTFRHPLEDALAYKSALSKLRDEIRAANRKDGGAISATTHWTVNGSAAKGGKMVRDFSKLMQRAYNAEAESLVKGLKPYRLQLAIDRLTKTTAVIERLGSTMDIKITPYYHKLRVKELELTADHVEKKAREAEQAREERVRLREEQRAQAELLKERAKVEKERDHKMAAASALRAKNDIAAATRLEQDVIELDSAIASLDFRAANVRAGYVYVISNVGSFGQDVVKIGMTRRLEPLDRIRELGDASVPFRYDVHALFFSEDAVGIENTLHKALETKRVNRVNRRREFFRATPAEVRVLLLSLEGDITHYEEFPEADEFRQSGKIGISLPEDAALTPQRKPSYQTGEIRPSHHPADRRDLA
ncbi:MAG: DUF4041 domain-containing protein [Propionibacteriaceae bacterium]